MGRERLERGQRELTSWGGDDHVPYLDRDLGAHGCAFVKAWEYALEISVFLCM